MSQIGKNYSFEIQGQEVTIETGKLATQADGSVVVKCNGMMLLATAVSAKTAKDGVDFMPLTVDYREKFSAAGRFPGGFLKRETRPSDSEILTSRLVDRALRPLFPEDYHADTQVLVSLISSDGETLPDAFACLAASASIAVSDIPFQEPISEVRIARIDGEFKVNPTKTEMESETRDIDIMVAATANSIVMVEGEMSECSEAEMLEAIKVAHDAIKIQCDAQLKLAELIGGVPEKREYSHETHDLELKDAVFAACENKIYELAKKGTSKKERSEGFKAIREEYKETFSAEDLAEKESLINVYFHDAEKVAVRKMILEDRTRLDGRNLDEIRAIWSEVDYLPYTHGSAIFTRGETQSLTSVTLGSKLDEQSIDGAVYKGSEKFILHYNFPPFSVGEARPMRGTSRREVGHGNLALRALKPMIPSGQENPYTIRIMSDILESNGSSSMATVCAGSMALMDTGIKIRKAVSGIAMGLITDGSNFAVLSDILGDEDHLGDMDFKVTGTQDGVTACQMDIKVGGLSYEIMEQALEQSKRGRLHILGEMNKTISEPNADYKPHVPRMEQMIIPAEFIGAVIGPGGKIIQEIQAETETVITIEEVDKTGVIDISSVDKEGIEAAKARIKGIVAQPEIGETYKGKVKSIQSYGAFVEVLPGKDGLLHVSEIAWKRVNDVKDYLKEGEEVEVKLVDIDKKTGKMKLSRKVLLPKPETAG
ncbi:MAG: polyribonucleotide nucleotidyltransferase [Crocinitomicaceae bacterium]|nr:polyribonucleotide nucleotidyltransferase [Crocinitomicaceae bacterium]|tara:strand:- start:16527 stop:18659 length:2133 start_codon:yes stop_codon:yes gene_type:complete